MNTDYFQVWKNQLPNFRTQIQYRFLIFFCSPEQDSRGCNNIIEKKYFILCILFFLYLESGYRLDNMNA